MRCLLIILSLVLFSFSENDSTHISFDSLKEKYKNKYDKLSESEIDSLIKKIPEGFGFEYNFRNDSRVSSFCDSFICCKRIILTTLDLKNEFIKALERKDKSLLLDFYNVENFELFYSDEFINELLSKKDNMWYMATDRTGLSVAGRINFISQCWDKNYGKIQNITHLNPFVKLIESDTIHTEPKFDYVSNYDWLSANLKDFPAFIQPTSGGNNYYRTSLDTLKNYLNIVQNNQIELYQAYKNGIYRNYIIDLENIDYSDCTLEDGLFYGIYNMYDNSCEKVNFGYMDKPGWQKYIDVFGFKIVDWEFRDVNNDNYMDVLLFFSCLTCGSMKGGTKVILTKTIKNQGMFQIIDIMKY